MPLVLDQSSLETQILCAHTGEVGDHYQYMGEGPQDTKF